MSDKEMVGQEKESERQKNEGLVASGPDLRITPSAYELLLSLMKQHAPREISGLGEVEMVGDNQLVITDIHYFGGAHSAAHTDITQELGNWLYQLAQSGGDASKVHLWWHSHGTLSVFWSQTDEGTMTREIAKGYLISLVGNERGEFRCRLDVYADCLVTHEGLILTVPALQT